MTVQPYSWEHSLLSMAYEAYASPTLNIAGVADARRLAQSYAQCAKITARNSHSFYIASAFLPAEKRRAVRALYAFCRITDDIVDNPDAAADADAQAAASHHKLAAWHKSITIASPSHHEPVALAFAHARNKYNVPWRYVEQLIEGVARDTIQKRYETFEDLASYAYGVASTVGLMSMHIIGFDGAEAIPYAVRLGVALQLTNILRDVAEDWKNGRLYLPLKELADFGLGEEDIARGVVTPAWQAFMRYQIARARDLYAEAMPGIAMLAPEGRFSITAAAELYRAILADIEAHACDNLSRRAHISTPAKLAMLPAIWRTSRA